MHFFLNNNHWRIQRSIGFFGEAGRSSSLHAEAPPLNIPGLVAVEAIEEGEELLRSHVCPDVCSAVNDFPFQRSLLLLF